MILQWIIKIKFKNPLLVSKSPQLLVSFTILSTIQLFHKKTWSPLDLQHYVPPQCICVHYPFLPEYGSTSIKPVTPTQALNPVYENASTYVPIASSDYKYLNFIILSLNYSFTYLSPWPDRASWNQDQVLCAFSITNSWNIWTMFIYSYNSRT